MSTLEYLFGIATATVFTFTAGLAARFVQFPFRPYCSVLATSRWLRIHHLTTVALVAFSFLVFALLPIGTGFSGRGAIQKIWQMDKREVEILYMLLFVLGSTVLTIVIGVLFNKLLHITRQNRRIFTDIFNVFVSFTILWFVLLAALVSYIATFFTSGSQSVENLTIHLKLKEFLENLGFSDVSDLFLSPALYVTLVLSSYFGYRMIARWSLRRDILNIVRGKDAQKALSRTLIMLSTATTAFAFIVVPGLYLALLSATLLTREVAREKAARPANDFGYQASCHLAESKLQLSMVVKNNRNIRLPLEPIFIVDKDGKFLRLNQADIFWLSRKGLYFDPSEVRYYRLELMLKPGQFSAGLCTVQEAKRVPHPEDYRPSNVSGDSYSVVSELDQMK